VPLKVRMGGVFQRSEGRQRAGAFLNGLLSGAERKTGWLMAEQAGLERPYRMQSMLGRGHIVKGMSGEQSQSTLRG
jgi:hypothetical protein